MDRIGKYRKAIQTLLEEYSKPDSQDDDVENALFFDTVRDRYQLMIVGWNDLTHMCHTILHFVE